MKLKQVINLDHFEKNEFLSFLIVLVGVCITSYVLAVNSSSESVFVGFFSFTASAVIVSTIVYFFPLIRNYFSPIAKKTLDLGSVLLVGLDGSRPVPKKRELDDMIRKTRI